MDIFLLEVILENIEIFMRLWSMVEIDFILLLLFSVVKEINNLKYYVIKGCLFGILLLGGVNRNEVIYKSLNKFLKWFRIGLELVYGFLRLLCYKWNEKIFCKFINKGREVVYIKLVEI